MRVFQRITALKQSLIPFRLCHVKSLGAAQRKIPFTSYESHCRCRVENMNRSIRSCSRWEGYETLWGAPVRWRSFVMEATRRYTYLGQYHCPFFGCDAVLASFTLQWTGTFPSFCQSTAWHPFYYRPTFPLHRSKSTIGFSIWVHRLESEIVFIRGNVVEDILTVP